MMGYEESYIGLTTRVVSGYGTFQWGEVCTLFVVSPKDREYPTLIDVHSYSTRGEELP